MDRFRLLTYHSYSGIGTWLNPFYYLPFLIRPAEPEFTAAGRRRQLAARESHPGVVILGLSDASLC